jgi:hypothetical protein
MRVTSRPLKQFIVAVTLVAASVVNADNRDPDQLTNVSVWDSLEHAEQMSRFQPMLDLGNRFGAKGATFLRPIPNFECLWQWGEIGGSGNA